MDDQRISCQQLASYVGLCLVTVRSPHNVRVSVGEGVFSTDSHTSYGCLAIFYLYHSVSFHYSSVNRFYMRLTRWLGSDL